MKIYPSILTDSFATAVEQLALVQPHEQIESVQIDLIDGHFAHNQTIGVEDLAELDFGRLKADIHLMVDEPMDWLMEIIEWGEQIPVRSVVAQIEHMGYQEDFLLEVKQRGWLAGLSVELYTPLDEIEARSWLIMDIVQLMSIPELGHQGLSFNPLVLPRIVEVKKTIDYLPGDGLERQVELLVDGGVELKVMRDLRKAGATGVAVGSDLWKAVDVDQAIEDFLNLKD